MNKPGKVTEPIAIRKGGKGASGSSGTATPRFAQKATTAEALPFDSYDAAVEAGGVSAPVTTTTQGALEGFDDNRGGIRKFIDSLSGRQSTADALNAQLAIGRDTTAQRLAGDLAVGEQGNAARVRELEVKLKGDAANADRIFNNDMTKLGLTEDAARNLQADAKAHAERMESIRNSNASEVEKQKAANLSEADYRKARIDLAAKNNLPLDRLDKAGDQLVASFTAAQTAAQDASGAISSSSKQAAAMADRMTTATGMVDPSFFEDAVRAKLGEQGANNFAKTLVDVKPGNTVFSPGRVGELPIRFTPGTPSTAAALGVPAVEGTPGRMDVMRALSALTGEGVTSPMFGQGNVANNYGMPTTAKVAPQSVAPGIVPQPTANPYGGDEALKAIANALYKFHPLSNVGKQTTAKSTEKASEDKQAEDSFFGPSFRGIRGIFQ